MIELEKTASVVYTPTQECGMIQPCDYCWKDRRDFKVDDLTGEDIRQTAASLARNGYKIRFQKLAGTAGEAALCSNLMEIVPAMIETLDKPELSVREGFRRIHLITNGLFWSEEKLQKLKAFKDYLLFAFSVDPKHHKASNLCHQKINTLDEMFTGEHPRVCEYLAQVKNTVDKVSNLFGEGGFVIQAVSGSEDNKIEKIADYFSIHKSKASDTVFIGTVCTPKTTEWDPTERQVTGNEDLIFIEKVKGQRKAYASFQDLLLGNPHAALQVMIDS